MRNEYFCPNCAAHIKSGDRYCGNCGTALRWVIPQTLDFEEAGQQGPANNTERLMNGEARKATGGPAVGTMAPLQSEIAKMLAEFEKHIKGQHNQTPAGKGIAS